MKKKTTCNPLVSFAARTALKANVAIATVTSAVLTARCDSTPATIVKTVIGKIVPIFKYVGAFFVVSGVFKLIQAYRTDQPENQASAAKDIVIGAVFIVFDVFIWNGIESVIF